MKFNSWEFPLFFLIVWGIYLCLKRKPQNVWLLASSYFFYGWWDWRFCSLLALSTVTDYFCGLLIAKQGKVGRWFGSGKNREKIILTISLTTSLGILGFFKYFNFFADSFERVLTPFGFQPDFVTLNIILPVGISFYTFQTMAYVIDVYRGKEEPCTNFIEFALYVAYFPQLVAGPIERAGNLIPQFAKDRMISAEQFYSGIRLIFWGFFKKIFIADGVAPYVNQCFAEPDLYNGAALIMGAYLFALQIYGDFSGYTDIARGVSRLFGIEICLNFRQPYLSANITEFWRRWHISLSSWLRDYLYISLGGNRKGKYRQYANLMITMLLGGLWHGAAWTFVIWGGLHGLYLAVHKAFTGKSVNVKDTATISRTWTQLLVKPLCIFITFNLVCFAWIFFRADSLGDALTYISRLGSTQGKEIANRFEIVFLFYLCTVLLIDLLSDWKRSETPVLPKNVFLRGLCYGSALFLLVFIGSNNSDPFVYFQF
jgi:D-alanyl-lipoteichoic acid acyltransferase DltB (MBOAT superfamily)